MSFSEVINGFFGLANQTALPFRVTILGSYGVYVEGAERVCEFKSGQISVVVKGGVISFFGKNLSLSAYVDKDLTIHGLVEKIEWQK